MIRTGRMITENFATKTMLTWILDSNHFPRRMILCTNQLAAILPLDEEDPGLGIHPYLSLASDSNINLSVSPFDGACSVTN